jgi:Ca-activated chloride channel family protein
MLGRIALVSMVCGSAFLSAQDASREAEPGTTFRTTSDLVQLNVSVFDKDGKCIQNLPQSAFTVYENGVPQQIKVFRQEDVPVSMGLVIDNSASMLDKRERVISATLAMIKASNPNDEVFIVNFDQEPHLAQEFTSDIGVLEKSLRSIKTQGETAMRDALLMGIQHLRHRATRDKKVLVVITDGDDNSSVETQSQLIEVAHQNNVIIYAIGLLGGELPVLAERAKKQIEEITRATGGRAWFPGDVAEIASITPEIAHEIRNQYIIGYTPTDLSSDGGFRTIRVDVNVPGATVRTRSGYYARR